MADRSRFRVVASRDGGAWLLRADELPLVFGQARRLDLAEESARDAIATHLGVAPESIDVDVVPVLDDPALEERVAAVRRQRGVVEAAQERYSSDVRSAIAELQRRGFPLRDVGRLLGISFARAGQLARRD
jgi:DNA-directed RNA polymerase specialized sigma24 family protein